MKQMRSFYLLACLLLVGCSETPNDTQRVGMDAYWYPLDFGTNTNNVTAFSTELLTGIGILEKIPFTKITVNWNDLVEGLQKEKYEAILTSMTPHIFNEKLFDFSKIYLPLGPVLIVQKDSKIQSIHAIDGKQIAVISGTADDLLLEKSPGVLIRYYDSASTALNDLIASIVDGALIDVVTAVAYSRDLYQGELEIISPPLNEKGLRLVTLHGATPDLIKKFNAGLEKMKKDGTYAKLLDKWSLQESIPK